MQEDAGHHTGRGRGSAVALGYALMGTWGMLFGLFLAWVF